MEKLGLSSAAVAFFGVGLVMVLYELARNKAGRPILKGSQAAQLYYIRCLTMFVLALVNGLKPIIG